MATDRRRASEFIERLRRTDVPDATPLEPPEAPALPPHARRRTDEAAVHTRLGRTGADERVRDTLYDPDTQRHAEAYGGFIEDFIGTAKIPIGLVGPLLIRGPHCNGAKWIPLATSEAALVASYQRGVCALSRAGGVTSILLAESVVRSPCFVFPRAEQAGQFIAWLTTVFDDVKRAAEGTSNYATLQDLRFTLEGNHAYVSFEYSSGDAAGQNMTTIATEAACHHIATRCPVAIDRWYLESNLSGDKKASTQSFCLVRGRKVTADAVLPSEVLQSEFRCSAEALSHYWRVSATGGILAGTLGVQGHFANGLAALYLATGQDIACVSESAMGVTRLEARPDGSLYASVTLPSLMLGTVGGGTTLPTASACLDLMGIDRTHGAAALAELTGALLLAGELSLVAAIVTGTFGRAHRVLRKRDRVARDARPGSAAAADGPAGQPRARE